MIRFSKFGYSDSVTNQNPIKRINYHHTSGLLMIGYTEIIVALIAVFGAAATYLLQKNKELNLEIAEKKTHRIRQFSKELYRDIDCCHER